MATLHPVRPLRRSEKTLWSSRAAHAWNDDDTCDVVVVDEFPTSLSACDEIETRARILVGARHPNLAAVRDVTRTQTSCSVVSDFVEGERLEDLRASGELTPDVSLRVVVDVLYALGALHDLDAHVVHGHVEPANVIVGTDGVARLVRGYLGPGRLVVIEGGAMHRIAPEVMREGDVDRRADVYGVGVLLKELLPEELPSWGTKLADVAARALARDPADRYATTADMARELRLVAQSHVARPTVVAALVERVAGDHIARRRAELALPDTRPPDPPPVAASDPASNPVIALDAANAPSLHAPAVDVPAPEAIRRRSGQTTRMLRASLKRVSRLWAATAGVAVILALGVVWMQSRKSTAPQVSPPTAIVVSPQPTATNQAPPAVEETVIELPATSDSSSAPARAQAARHRAPAKPIDRSAIF